jgi:gamma-tubulin complex component 3
MLYFIYQLADPPPINPLQEARPSASNRLPSNTTAIESNAQTSPPTPKRPPDHQFNVNSPAFNEAFSNAGLLRLPQTEEPGASKAERPISRQRRDRTKEKEATNGDAEAGASPEPQIWIKYDALTPAEPNLLRDLPFTLQGLSSTNFNFASNKILKLPETLPVPIISLLHTLAEPCLLYKRLSEFVESNDGGLVGQSFRSALSIELRAYLGLVATLEGQIRRALAQLDESQPRQGIGKAGVTLKRCVVWTREATMGLRLMSLMVEESKGLLKSLSFDGAKADMK